jgi:hypothetical protein
VTVPLQPTGAVQEPSIGADAGTERVAGTVIDR